MADYTTISYNGFALDSLGEISVLSQSGRMVPDKLGQKEIRQIRIRVEMFEQDYDTNYSLLSQARSALEEQNKGIVWVSPGIVLSTGDETAGTTILDRPVVVVSHDIPEDPNAWGTYNQQINVVVEFEVDLTDPTVHLAATFKQTGAAGQPTNLGMITSFGEGYRSTKYSDMRNIRQRAAGSVDLKGELFAGLNDLNGPLDTRRATLLALVQAFYAQVDGRDGTLTYGLPTNAPQDNQTNPTYFNKVVRVAAFEAHINQALNGIEWSMTADWTEFPNEATYAAADFRVERSEERETGEKFVRLTGNIGAPTPTVANSKLTLLMQTVIYNAQACDGDSGWTGLAPMRYSTTPRYINSDDTQSDATVSSTQTMGTEDGTGDPTSNSVFISLDFSIEWRKKSASLVSWKLTVNTQDDAAGGLQRLSYSGSVVCSGATADAAWNTALAQARVLGDQKYPFRMTYSEVRHDRFLDAEGSPPKSFNPIIGQYGSSSTGYTGAGIQEFVECAFSYEYRVKGSRIYIEARADQTVSTFGENGLRVNGFVVAPTQAAAMTVYQGQVKATYLPALILEEEISNSADTIQTGVPWGQTAGFNSMFIKLDFSFRIWQPKTSSQFAINFGIKSDIDYTSLKRTLTIDGTYWDTQANIVNAENLAVGNTLDLFLVQLMAGRGTVNKLSDSRTQGHYYLGNTTDDQIGLKFSQVYVSLIPANSAQLLLETSVSEDVQYSGNRNREFAVPNGPSVIQQLGITMGSRTVSGSVTAATEAAAVAWLSAQRALIFPGGTAGAVAAPNRRYLQPPRISTEFLFLPLTANPDARGGTVNFQVVKKNFTFSELLPNARYVDGGGGGFRVSLDCNPVFLLLRIVCP